MTVKGMDKRMAVWATALFVTGGALLAQGQAPTGQIRGSVQAVDGTPVANALVMINIQPGPNARPFSARVTTTAGGTFLATAVPDGTFHICPQLPGSELLAPCSWDANPPTATVSGGQPVTIPPIQMQQGVRLKVRMNDPAGRRAAMEGTVDGATVHIDVRRTAGGLSMPIPTVNTDPTGRDHDVVVPSGVPIQVFVFSKVFALAGGANRAPIDRARGATVDVNIERGSVPEPLVFHVTGLNP